MKTPNRVMKQTILYLCLAGIVLAFAYDEISEKTSARITAQHPHISEKILKQADELEASHDWPGMMKLGQTLIENNQERAFAWSIIGTAHDGLGQNDKAILAYKEAIKVNAYNAFIWNNLGAAYVRIKEFGKAAEVFQRALELDLKDANTLNHLGIVYDALGKCDEANKAYEKVVSLKPIGAEGWSDLRTACQDLHIHDKAAEASRNAIKIEPNMDRHEHGDRDRGRERHER